MSPTVSQLVTGDTHCASGGAAITDAQGSTAYVCNGAGGANGADDQSFSGTFTSPSGQFSIAVGDAGITLAGPGSTIELDATGGVSVIASTNLDMKAGASASLNASGPLSLKTSRDGLLQAAGVLSLKGSVINQN